MKFLTQKKMTPIEAVCAAFTFLDQGRFESGLINRGKSEAYAGFYIREYADNRNQPLLAAAAMFTLSGGKRKTDALFDRLIRIFYNRCLSGPCSSGGRLLIFSPGFDSVLFSRLNSLRIVNEAFLIERYDQNHSFSAFRCFKQTANEPELLIPGYQKYHTDFFHGEQQGAILAETLARLLPGCIPRLHRGKLNLINKSGLTVASLISLADARFRLVVGPAGTRRHTVSREVRETEDIINLNDQLQARAQKLKSVKAPENKLATLLQQDRLRQLSAVSGMDLVPIESPPRPFRGPVDLLAFDRKTNRRILIELKVVKDPLILWQVTDYYRSLARLFGKRGLGPVLLVAPAFHARLFDLARLLDFETIFISFDRPRLLETDSFDLPPNSLKKVCRVRPRKLTDIETATMIRARCDTPTRTLLDDLEKQCRKIGLIRFIPSHKIIAYRLHATARPIPVIHLDPQAHYVTFSIRLDRLGHASIDAGRIISAFKSLFPQPKLSRCFIRSEIANEEDIRAASLFCTILGEEIELSSCFDFGRNY
jgi:hypothetical protein